MKIFQKLILVFLFGFSVVSMAQALNGNTQNVFTQDKPVVLATPDKSEFIIKLKSNPTTGYSWYLRSYDDHLIVPVSHHYQHATSQLVGAPGFEMWTFKVKPEGFSVPQVSYIRFVYTRPWEPASQGNTVVEFKVTIMPGTSQQQVTEKPVY